jgi:hypothetical protein
MSVLLLVVLCYWTDFSISITFYENSDDVLRLASHYVLLNREDLHKAR